MNAAPPSTTTPALLMVGRRDRVTGVIVRAPALARIGRGQTAVWLARRRRAGSSGRGGNGASGRRVGPRARVAPPRLWHLLGRAASAPRRRRARLERCRVVRRPGPGRPARRAGRLAVLPVDRGQGRRAERVLAGWAGRGATGPRLDTGAKGRSRAAGQPAWCRSGGQPRTPQRRAPGR